MPGDRPTLTTADPAVSPLAAPRRSGLIGTGVCAAAVFGLLIVGSNIPTPLFPIYRVDLALTTATVSALFAVYLFALVVTFTLVAGSPLSRHASRVLPAAATAAILGDVALVLGADQLGWLFVGRILTGLAVGLGTGSAATLVLATHGERGRAIAATGTLIGSFLGLLGSALIAQYLPGPTVTVYLVHIALLVTALALLGTALIRNRRELHRSLHPSGDAVPVELSPRHAPDLPTPDAGPASATPARSRRLRAAGYCLGISGWAIGGIVVGLLPTIIAQEWSSSTVLTTALAPTVLIGAACLAPVLIRRLPPLPVLVLIAVGAVSCTAGVLALNLPAILIACAIWGAGQGFAYASGLRIVTAGLSPIPQGRAASRYASVCYGCTGILSISTGIAATAFGAGTAMIAMAAVFVTFTGATAVAGHRRWPAGI